MSPQNEHACASSLLAVTHACSALVAGDIGYVVAGGSGVDIFNINDSAADGIIVFGKDKGDTFNISVAFDGLLIELAKSHKVDAIMRGLRAVSDFEYELQIALINRKLCPEIETVFMMPSAKYAYLSSRIVKEVAGFGGCINGFVPEIIEQQLLDKLRQS